ncbi:hypothetical protein [Pseudomonas sp. GXZC]|uniref:hypothetical protein n=1 Tax=Pseudomonas sp. GXZC TaxID=3003351 RepID=UPI0022AACC2E|nr:hypothetical protein [Pseudomonas sp. GXZC]WAT26913.1 hypothetical protein OZ428_23445 [Pseudomonas sp. GXZC]
MRHASRIAHTFLVFLDAADHCPVPDLKPSQARPDHCVITHFETDETSIGQIAHFARQNAGLIVNGMLANSYWLV